MSSARGNLDWQPLKEHPGLVAPTVADANAPGLLVAPVDDSLSDTAAFCQAYDVTLEAAANCVVVQARRGENTTYAAVIHLTEELAIELGPDIRVNAVAPAVVKTKFAEALYSGREEQVAKPYPLKRLGEPEDIGSVVAFLASDDSGWMTGQTLTVDGGVLLNGGV